MATEQAILNDGREILSSTRRSNFLGHVPQFFRLAQSGQYLRRLIGLPVWQPEDFLFDLAPETQARLAAIARRVRGPAYRPAIFVNGVLPRSGTNFIANALALHPDVAGFPRDIHEFPLLEIAPGGAALQHEWLSLYPANAALVQPFEVFGYLASGWLADLQADAPDRQLLFKSPHVRQIALFRALLPRDKLVLCLRDGRDIIASTVATFERGLLGKGFRERGVMRKTFRQLVAEWRLATEAVLAFAPGGPRADRHTVVVRYEDVVQDPQGQILQILPKLGLDPARFPVDALKRLPVFGSSTSRTNGEQSWEPVKREAGFNPIGRFECWPEHRKRAFLHLAGDVLARAGYV
jgi:protein-tyrosine sulfotransferase